jgi:hypothetical protein
VEEQIIQRFHDAYIKADSKELDELWENSAPTSLVKFFPAKYTEQGVNYFCEGISKKTLWLSSPRLFNDPFDGFINYDYTSEIKAKIQTIFRPLLEECTPKKPGYDAIFQKKLAECYLQYNKEMNASNRRFESQMFIACFSEKESIYSSRMWGHYANNHAGVCAEYDWDTVVNASPFGCIPIKYTDTYEYFSNPSNKAEETIDFLKFFTKAKEWEHEKEWRVAQVSNAGGDGFCVPLELPKKVYLGCNSAPKLIADVLGICLSHNIEVYKMKLQPNSYCLTYEKIEIK